MNIHTGMASLGGDCARDTRDTGRRASASSSAWCPGNAIPDEILTDHPNGFGR